MAALTSAEVGTSEWWKKLSDAGIIPPQVRHMIIDIPLNGLVRIYYETNAEESMLANLPNLLRNAELIDVNQLIKDHKDGTAGL